MKYISYNGIHSITLHEIKFLFYDLLARLVALFYVRVYGIH